MEKLAEMVVNTISSGTFTRVSASVEKCGSTREWQSVENYKARRATGLLVLKNSIV